MSDDAPARRPAGTAGNHGNEPAGTHGQEDEAMTDRASSWMRLTRRRALELLGLSGAGALLAACSAPAPASPTAAPAKPTTASAAAAGSPAAAASPAASPALAASPAAGAPRAAGISASEWDQLVAAARQEGTVATATYAGSAYRRVMDAF